MNVNIGSEKFFFINLLSFSLQFTNLLLIYTSYHSSLYILNLNLFLVFTRSQEPKKTIVIAAMLVSQTKEIIKIFLFRAHQHGRYNVR